MHFTHAAVILTTCVSMQYRARTSSHQKTLSQPTRQQKRCQW